ncbi:retropepsin-like domain-containing protein, partial [Salmonella enterica]|nr:retropepsin-like domain-containing protein [Salmonella enterica]
MKEVERKEETKPNTRRILDEDDENKPEEETTPPVPDKSSDSIPLVLNQIPYPQRFQKKKLDAEFSKFLDIFKQLHINIPFADALEQMPHYAKFMKEILSKKRKFENHETVNMTAECSAIIQKHLPPKLKDPGSFTLPCTVGSLFIKKALCDLGASINLMPFSVYRKLGLGELKSTTIVLQLADRSMTYPKGVLEDVLVNVDKFIFPADFVVLDMEEDPEVPIILGRPFLATARALIEVQKGTLTLRVEDDEVVFNLFNALKHPEEVSSCFSIDSVDTIINACVESESPVDHYEISMPDVFGDELIDVNQENALIDRSLGREEKLSLDICAQVDVPSPELKQLPAHLRYA